MTIKKRGFTIEADIHGMTVIEAKKALERLISSADKSVKEIEVIHGYSNGTALQTMIRTGLKHKRIKSKMLSMNPGITTIILKDI